MSELIRRPSASDHPELAPRKRTLGWVRRLRARGRNRFSDFFHRLYPYEEDRGKIREEHLVLATLGILAVLAAAAAYAAVLPSPSSVEHGTLRIFGIKYEIRVGVDGIKTLLAVLGALPIPLLVIGSLGLLTNIYLSLRPVQPFGWHVICLLELVLAVVIVGTGVIAVGLIAFNLVFGAAVGAAAAIAALAFGVVILFLAGALLSFAADA
jgi:hypothetical protein